VRVDDRGEKMGLKIREAEKQKVPYMLIVGDQEVENQLVSVRKRKEGDIGKLKVEEVLDALNINNE
jgi:threonyl-tRNA synthetase